MNQKTCKRFWCFFLATVLIVLVLPVPGSAASAEQDVETEQAAIYEVTALRDETTKHFAMPDGTYLAVSYGEAIHERDENGQWQEIDNRLQAVEAKGTQFYANDSGRAAFTKSLSMNKPIFTVDDGSYGISMSLAPNSLNTEIMSTTASESEAVIHNARTRSATAFSTLKEATEFDTSSTVVYSNALPGVDLEYTLRGRNVKENIIIKTKADSYSYRFALELNGLIARQEADGGIVLFDPNTDEVQYVIPTGYMYDANKTVSYEVTYSLSNVGNTYYLTVVADAGWINAKERAWPITVDPTMVKDTSIQDTYVRPGNSYMHATHGTSNLLWLGSKNSVMGQNVEANKVFIKGTLPMLPEGATISSAYMKLYYYYFDNITSGTVNAAVYSVNSPWEESTATWHNTLNLITSTSPVGEIYTSAAYGATVDNPRAVYVMLSNLVKTWYATGWNCGVMLRYSEGTNSSVIFRSSESGDGYSPHFYITYEVDELAATRIPDGIYSLENEASLRVAKFKEAPNYVQDRVAFVTHANRPAAFTDDCLFKLNYVGERNSENAYTIRPMQDNALLLTATGNGNEVEFTLINDQSIPNACLWAISYDEGQYRIKSLSTTDAYLAVPESAAESGTSSKLQLTTGGVGDDSWVINARTTETNTPRFVAAPNSVRIGESVEFLAVPRCNQPNVHGSVQYEVKDAEGNQTDLAHIDSDTGLLEANNCGIVKIGAKTPETNEEEWKTVYICNYNKKLQIYYDYGYLSRFPEAVARINFELEELTKFYFEEFGLYVDCSISGVYESSADKCIGGASNYDSVCNCKTDNSWCEDAVWIDNDNPSKEVSLSDHHKNITNMVYELGMPGAGFDFRITYTGHACCYNDTIGQHQAAHDAVRGRAIQEYRIACVANRTNDLDSETLTLIHEFGHLFGTQDHYSNALGPHKDFCIYGYNKDENTTVSGFQLCNDCRAVIEGSLEVGQ